MNSSGAIIFIIVLFNGLASHCARSSHVRAEDYDLDIRMPAVSSEAPDELVCTAVELDPDEAYIVKYTPHASKETTHHMMVFGCGTAASQQRSWRCNIPDRLGSENSVCGNGEERQILFAWALDAPARALPDGVGFRVGGSTGVRHIIVQLHYARKFADGEVDRSGVTLKITHQRPVQQMGYYVLGSRGAVPPEQEEVHLETACQFNGRQTIYPIGYRTHSHNLGVVTAGYRIRDGEWTEIGRMSPQLPQTFYPVTNPGMDIRPGDILAARCTMNSLSRSSQTIMGPRNHDEMCNFYIMYSTYRQDNLQTEFCFPHTSDFTWSENLREFFPPPANVSTLEGIPDADQVRAKFSKAMR